MVPQQCLSVSHLPFEYIAYRMMYHISVQGVLQLNGDSWSILINRQPAFIRVNLFGIITAMCSVHVHWLVNEFQVMGPFVTRNYLN